MARLLDWAKGILRALDGTTKRQAETLAGRVLQLQRRLDKAKDELAALRDAREILRRRLATSRQESATLRQQLATSRQKSETLGRRLAASWQEGKSLRRQLAGQRARTAKVEDSARRQLASLRTRIASLQNEVHRQNGALQKASARALLAEALATGKPVDKASVEFVRTLMKSHDGQFVRSVAHSLAETDATAAAGRICSALYALKDGFDATAWRLFSSVDRELALTLAPIEYLAAWLHHAPQEAARFIHSLYVSRPDRLTPAEWVGVAGRLGSCGLLDDMKGVVEFVAAGRQRDLSGKDADAFKWMHARLCQVNDAISSTRPGRSVSVAFIDYKTLDPERSSRNVGDYIQTLAAMAHVCRFQNVDFADGSELGSLIEELKERIPHARRINDVKASATPLVLDRDFASGRVYPEPTWLICFGWLMHPNFGRYFDFPYPDTVRPIFISVHIANRDLLSSKAVDYLKRHEPVGCRDWTSVYLLRDRGIRAFFSGCITSTIGLLFNDEVRCRDDDIALVDDVPKSGEFEGKELATFTHVDPEVRVCQLATNLRRAEALLERYRNYRTVVTSRLHCYLPCRALGLDVSFRPKRATDTRFEGLLDLDPQAMARIGGDMTQKLESVLRAIFSGKSPADIYGLWSELCEPNLQQADAYCATYDPDPEPTFDVQRAVAAARKAARDFGPPPAADAIQVALSLDENLRDQLPVVLESLVSGSSRPLRVHVLARGLEADYFAELSLDFPDVSFCIFDCNAIDYGGHVRMLKHTSVSTMDRLFLPEILPGLDRIIYLDLDIVVLGDIAELDRVDLEGRRLVGRSSTFPEFRYGTAMVYSAAGALDHRSAWDLRRRMHAAGSLHFPACNAGVLIMNLERMRRERFTYSAIGLVTRYAMNDQDALNVYARKERGELAASWNVVPVHDIIESPKLIHFAGPVKPWSGWHMFFRQHYLRYKAAYDERRTRRVSEDAPGSPRHVGK